VEEEEMEDTIAIVLVEEDAEAVAVITAEAGVVTTEIGMIGEHLNTLDVKRVNRIAELRNFT
jgi:hypothetical protein